MIAKKKMGGVGGDSNPGLQLLPKQSDGVQSLFFNVWAGAKNPC